MAHLPENLIADAILLIRKSRNVVSPGGFAFIDAPNAEEPHSII